MPLPKHSERIARILWIEILFDSLLTELLSSDLIIAFVRTFYIPPFVSIALNASCLLLPFSNLMFDSYV